MIVSDKTMHTIASVCRIYQDCSLRALQLPPEQAQGQSIWVDKAITAASTPYVYIHVYRASWPWCDMPCPISDKHTCFIRSVF